MNNGEDFLKRANEIAEKILLDMGFNRRFIEPKSKSNKMRGVGITRKSYMPKEKKAAKIKQQKISRRINRRKRHAKGT